MTIDQIRCAVLAVVKEYPIIRVSLFGSRAKGTETENSDVDLIIEFSEPITLITLSKISQNLEEILNVQVDIIHGPIQNNDMFSIDKEIEIYAA